MPVGSFYAQALLSWRPSEGVAGTLEAGYHPWAPLSLFGYGRLDSFGPSAGVGARLDL